METFGLVYVESVLNGIPTILSDNAGHKSAFEYMNEQGYICLLYTSFIFILNGLKL